MTTEISHAIEAPTLALRRRRVRGLDTVDANSTKWSATNNHGGGPTRPGVHFLHIISKDWDMPCGLMGLHFGQATKTGIAVPVQLLGVGKAAFDRLFARRIPAVRA